MRLLIAVVVWVAAVAGAAALSSAVADSVKEKGGGSSSGASSSSGGSSSVDASSVKAADAISLFHAPALARTLAVVRGHRGPEASFSEVVIYPGYISLTEVKGTGEYDIYAAVNGNYDETSMGDAIGNDPLFSIGRVSPDAPARLAQRIAAGAHVPLSSLHYMVLRRDSDTHRLQWLIYTVAGSPVTYFQVNGVNGRIYELRRNSSTGLEPVRG